MDRLKRALGRSQVVALLGPRQCGKTTLARLLVDPRSPNYFDLEDPASAGLLDEPMTVLGGLAGLVVIDEVQRAPGLFPVLRVLADRDPLPARFLILGSASPELVKKSSESLAGRLETVALGGLGIEELGADAVDRHWLRGGFPRSFLAKTDQDSAAWRKGFVAAFLERDLPRLGTTLPAQAMLRFWMMLGHCHGQVWSAADPARSLGVSQHTVRRYLDLLTGLFVVRQLQPWHANLAKRQVRAPKVYLRDSGLLHQLLGVGTRQGLFGHPRCGASWEGYVVEEVTKAFEPDEAYFWATHNGAEIDLMMIKDGRAYGVECKMADAPRLTPSMRIALDDLALERVAVVYPGQKRLALHDRVEAVPVGALADGAGGLFPK